MTVTLVSWLVGLAGVYLTLGVVFAIPFLLKGVGRIDPSATESTVGFKLIIFPGVIALWPLLAKRWLTGATVPPEEKNPHRDAAHPPRARKPREDAP